jgi:hypothetical protein
MRMRLSRDSSEIVKEELGHIDLEPTRQGSLLKEASRKRRAVNFGTSSLDMFGHLESKDPGFVTGVSGNNAG